MEKSSKQRTVYSTLFSLLGRKGRIAALTRVARRAAARQEFSFPKDITQARAIVIILPEDPLDALLQVANVVSLLAHFNAARVTLLCEKNVPAFFKSIHGVASIVSYAAEDRFLFSREFRRISIDLRVGNPDVCFFLERRPDLALQHLAIQTRALARIGYDGNQTLPFLNVRIRSDAEGQHHAERNLLMCKVIGIKPAKTVRWVIPKEVTDEIDHLLQEAGILKKKRIAGIDATSLYRLCGAQWVTALLEELDLLDRWTIYLFGDSSAPDDCAAWVRSIRRPIFWGLSSTRAAALINRSNLVIGGPSLMYEMAYLLGTHGIGLFDERSMPQYCRNTALSQGVIYSSPPDATIRRAVVDLAAAVQP
jgi:ADP-heptose:LPS heptosyltransferase